MLFSPLIHVFDFWLKEREFICNFADTNHFKMDGWIPEIVTENDKGPGLSRRRFLFSDKIIDLDLDLAGLWDDYHFLWIEMCVDI